jgi:Zn-dependent alcohol dehydrogenase
METFWSKSTWLGSVVRIPPVHNSRAHPDLIGSDLHFYRGTEGPATGFTLGHELLGEVVEVGAGIKKFQKGDLVIAPFSLSCGEFNPSLLQ